MKKTTAIAAACAASIAALTLTACGGSSSSDASTDAAASTTASGPAACADIPVAFAAANYAIDGSNEAKHTEAVNALAAASKKATDAGDTDLAKAIDGYSTAFDAYWAKTGDFEAVGDAYKAILVICPKAGG